MNDKEKENNWKTFCFKGGDFDPLSRRVLCASSGEVAQKASKLLTQYYPDRD